MMKKLLKFFGYMVGLPLLCRILYLIISSYAHNYSEPIWQPYQVGDSVVFLNNKEANAKWGISQINSYSNPSDPLLLLTHRIFSTFVSTKENFDAIIHIRTEQGKTVIYFEPPFGGGIKVIENENNMNVTPIRYNQMDLLRITPHETDLRIEPYQDSIYWSPQFGYVKVFYSNNVVWELKEFKRDGKIIYKLDNNGFK